VTVRRIARRLAAAVLVGLAAGCSNLKPYPNDLPIKNVTIRTAASAGSVFSSVKVELDVHSVDASCATRYLGTLQLDQPTMAVSLPSGRGSLLTFQFLSSNVLGSSRGSISRRVFVTPRPDQRFEIDVTYRDDLYDVVVRERVRNDASREVALRDLSACRSS
jgi:hypothetical protein